MTTLPITLAKFANKRFLRNKDFSFSSSQAMAELVAREFPKAALAFPIAFVQAAESFKPVAVLSLQPGKNLLVDRDGRWLGTYIPAEFRGFPFLLAKTEDGRQILCVNDAHGSVSETEGEPFFDDNGQITSAVKEILDFLSQVALNRETTLKLMTILQKYQLFTPWQIQVQIPHHEAYRVDGLFCVDETALNGLGADVLKELQESGALLLIYCQLLSMQHLSTLQKLAVSREISEKTESSSQNESSAHGVSFAVDNTTISYENLS